MKNNRIYLGYMQKGVSGMVIMNLILIGSMYVVLLILYFFLKLEISDKKATVLGIAVPEMMRKSEEVTVVCRRYLRDLRRLMMFLVIFPVTFFWMADLSFAFYMLLYMIWVFLSVGAAAYPCAKYGEQIKELKRKNEWENKEKPENGESISADVLPPVRTVRKGLTAVFCLLSVVPAAAAFFSETDPESRSEDVLILLSLAGMVWIICLLILWMDRQKSEMISRDTDVNLKFNRDKKRMRTDAWNWMAGLSVLFVWGTAFAMRDEFRGMAVWLAGVIVYSILILIICAWCEWKIIRMRRKMMTSLEEYDREESCWYFGALIYYNPEDRHFLVENRIGSGYSVNLGSVGGKVSAVLTGVLLLFCLIGVPLLIARDEFTPVGLEIRDETLCALHTGTEYEIPEDEIAAVSLITELPEMSRRNGTGLPNLLKGRFRTEDREDIRVCLNPENSRFLKVETTENKIYLFSGSTDEETEKVYRMMTGSR